MSTEFVDVKKSGDRVSFRVSHNQLEGALTRGTSAPHSADIIESALSLIGRAVAEYRLDNPDVRDLYLPLDGETAIKAFTVDIHGITVTTMATTVH